MLNIADVKVELQKLLALPVDEDRRSRAASDMRMLELERFAEQYAAKLVELAELGYELSRIAACSEKRNQPLFLRGLFEKVTELQSKITDGKGYMQRDMPGPEEL